MTSLDQPVEGVATWRGSELFERQDWLITLDAELRRELANALASVGEHPVGTIDRNDFPLPTLSPRLGQVGRDLESESGASLIRGLPLPDDNTAAARLFFGLASHIGTAVSQSADGHRLLHVRNEGFADNDPRLRGPLTNKRLAFHTDRCDVIAFLCLQPAKSGGDNHVISSPVLYNEILRRAPDAAQLLRGTFPYLRHSVDLGNQKSFTMVPVFAMHNGHFAASLLRVLIDRADRADSAPTLAMAQRRALDVLEDVAEDPNLYASFRLQRGDLLLLNNWLTLHRRTAFEDYDEPERRRHLLRLWLSVPNSRPLDPRFAEHFGATEAGALRGGLRPLPGPTPPSNDPH